MILWRTFKKHLRSAGSSLKEIRRIERALGLSSKTIVLYILEVLFDFKFGIYLIRQIRNARKTLNNDSRLGGWIEFYTALLVYALIRTKKPETVLETGVGPGSTSALILNALRQNSKGALYSIDLPGHDSLIYPKIGRMYNVHVPPGFDVGWMVPSWLKDRWILTIGDAKEKLPEILASPLHVDIFLHDSLHTDEHIEFELRTVLPFMKTGGLLLADDVDEYWSLAFAHWCTRNEIPFVVFRRRLGIAIVGNKV